MCSSLHREWDLQVIQSDGHQRPWRVHIWVVIVQVNRSYVHRSFHEQLLIHPHALMAITQDFTMNVSYWD